MQMNHKVIVVTGAGQGMGGTIARLFASEGARVVANDLDPGRVGSVVQEINDSGGTAAHFVGDVSDETDVDGLISTAIEQFGAVDVLVNNAGILRPTRVEMITTREYDEVVDVCMKSCFLCSRRVIPVMRERRWGRIINMSSSAGRSVSTLGGCHYTAAKAGMLGLTRAIAKEVAPDGITVNAVCPGLIDTDMVRKTVSTERIDAYIRSFPALRLGTAEEVAHTVLFLASTAAAYITGAAIDINGGDLML